MVLTVLLAGAAMAQGASPAAKAREEISRDFSKGDFEAAIKKATDALKKATDASDQAALQLLRGQALLALGQSEKAKAAFLSAVQKNPDIELDTARASPDAVRLLERVRGELPATLVVVVNASDADVTIDDKDLGPAPLQTQVVGGVHVVIARGADGRSTRVEAQVPPGKKVVLEMELTPKQPAMTEPAPVETSKDVPFTSQPAIATSVSPLRPAGLALVIGGGVVLVAGAVALGLTLDAWNKLRGSTFLPGEGEALAATGTKLQTLGWVGVGVGAAVAATGVVLLWRAGQAPPATVSVAPLPGGAMVGLTGSLP